MKGIRRWAIVLIILIVALAIGAVPRWQRHSQLAEAAATLGKTPPRVIVVRPHRAADSGVMLPGTTIAGTEVQVNARGPGYVARYYADIGSKVKTGQVLADIQAPDVDAQFKQAKAQTLQSVASLRQAQAQETGLRAQVLQGQAQEHSSVALVLQSEATGNSYRSKVTEAERALRQSYANRKFDISQLALDQKELVRYRWLASEGFSTQEQADQQHATYYSQQAKVEADSEAIKTAAATVDDARAAWKAALAAVHSAEANVESARQNVAAARASLAGGAETIEANRAAVAANQFNEKRFFVLAGFEKLVAPFDGIVTARNVDIGSLVNVPSSNVSDTDPTATAPRTGLFAVARLNPMLIQVDLPQTFVNGVQVGDPADVYVRELPGRKFPGRVILASGALDETTRTMQVKVSVSNPAGRLRPGMFAYAHLRGMHLAQILHVPATALIFDAQGTRLAVVTADDVLRFRPVEVGRDFGSDVEILNGLTGDERVVETPQDNLTDGIKVRPIDQHAETAQTTGH